MQVQYSLLYRRPETNGVFEACKEQGVTLVAYSPLCQGLLTGEPHSIRNTGFYICSTMACMAQAAWQALISCCFHSDSQACRAWWVCDRRCQAYRALVYSL
jgi:diketogulonate reductase-like aldo/keto reductase